MKKILLLAFLLNAVALSAQKEAMPTDVFMVTGLVSESANVYFNDLQKFTLYKIGNVKITSHNGEPRGELRKLKGVLLKDVLNKVGIQAENPRILSEYYVICTAADGYKNVYSWNELFNTNVGNSTYIVTEMDGKSMADADRRIMLLSPKDFRTGRRNLKWLTNIEVQRIE